MLPRLNGLQLLLAAAGDAVCYIAAFAGAEGCIAVTNCILQVAGAERRHTGTRSKWQVAVVLCHCRRSWWALARFLAAGGRLMTKYYISTQGKQLLFSAILGLILPERRDH